MFGKEQQGTLGVHISFLLVTVAVISKVTPYFPISGPVNLVLYIGRVHC